MTLVSEQDIADARSARDVAQHAVAAAMARVGRSTAPGVDVEAVSEYATAIARRDLAQARIAALEAEREAQLAELEALADAERAASGLIMAALEELNASRTRVLASVQAAESALSALHGEGERHAALVATHSAALLAADLRPGELTGEPATYGTAGHGLRLAGTYWHAGPTLAALLLGRVAFGVARELLPHNHSVVIQLGNAARLRGTEGRTLSGLLASEPPAPAPAPARRSKAGVR